MSQRLGIAGALLGDPPVLLFDEPVNGLDPEGIRWIRTFFRSLAVEGRTVFVSSHLMSEMAQSADEIVVIGRGRLITQGTVDELTASDAGSVLVRSADNAALRGALEAAGNTVDTANDGTMTVRGASAEAIGQAALAAGVALTELTPQRASLEEVFMGPHGRRRRVRQLAGMRPTVDSVTVASSRTPSGSSSARCAPPSSATS